MGDLTATVNSWDPELYDGKHGLITRRGEGMIDTLDPRPGERILDLGCGTGHLARQIADRGAEVIGLDSSPAMIEHARAAYPDLRFVVADAADFDLHTAFDAVFSNAALHWVHDASGAAACILRALRPGGRFVASLGGKNSVASLERAVLAALAAFDMPPPRQPLWYFPTPAEYATTLEAAGFRVCSLAYFDMPTPMQGDGGLINWLRQFVPAILESVQPERREAFVSAVEERVRPHLFRDGTWIIDYVRLSVIARRP